MPPKPSRLRGTNNRANSIKDDQIAPNLHVLCLRIEPEDNESQNGTWREIPLNVAGRTVNVQVRRLNRESWWPTSFGFTSNSCVNAIANRMLPKASQRPKGMARFRADYVPFYLIFHWIGQPADSSEFVPTHPEIGKALKDAWNQGFEGGMLRRGRCGAYLLRESDYAQDRLVKYAHQKQDEQSLASASLAKTAQPPQHDQQFEEALDILRVLPVRFHLGDKHTAIIRDFKLVLKYLANKDLETFDRKHQVVSLLSRVVQEVGVSLQLPSDKSTRDRRLFLTVSNDGGRMSSGQIRVKSNPGGMIHDAKKTFPELDVVFHANTIPEIKCSAKMGEKPPDIAEIDETVLAARDLFQAIDASTIPDDRKRELKQYASAAFSQIVPKIVDHEVSGR